MITAKRSAAMGPEVAIPRPEPKRDLDRIREIAIREVQNG